MNNSAPRAGGRSLRTHALGALGVFVGGIAGTLARAGISDVVAAPWALLGINTLGAFLLGVLLGWLSTQGDAPGCHTAKLTLGTGFLGAFTTYSALALFAVGSAVSLGLAALSVLVGVAVAGVGLYVGTRPPRSGKSAGPQNPTEARP